MLNALSIDVEDYFQVNAFAGNIRRDDWDNYPLRVGDNTRRVLEMLERHGVKATFFVLGWVAQRLPELVRTIHAEGHEIACHGYGHELIYRIGKDAFRRDVRMAKGILEDICGEAVHGYRAPSYSITGDSLWALDVLKEEGFTYDSSIFPVMHDTYGIPGARRFPHDIATAAGPLREFPLSTRSFSLGGRALTLPVAGGGYLRLLPVALMGRALRHLNEVERQPAIVYFHPWEIDPAQPRIKEASLKSRFRHYVNLHRMQDKIEYLLNAMAFAPVRTVLTGADR